MDVRKKLTHILASEPELLKNLNVSIFKLYRLVDELIDHGVTVQEWIPTSERMPTEDDATDGYVAVAYVDVDGVKTRTISLVDVVIAYPDLYDYWMPLNLPQPPKG